MSDALSIEARMAQLERTLAWHRRAIGTGVVLGLSLLAMGQAVSTPDVLRTRKLEILDEQDKVRAVLTVRKGNVAGLTILDSSGAPRAMLHVVDGGNALAMFTDKKAVLRAQLGVADNDQPLLTLRDGESRIRSTMGLTAAGLPAMQYYSPEQKPLMRLACGDKGTSLELKKPDGTAISKLAIEGNGEPCLLLGLGKDLPAALLTSSATGGTQLSMSDGKQVRAVMGVSDTGSGFYSHDEQGRIRAGLTSANGIGPRVYVAGPDTKAAATMELAVTGLPAIWLRDADLRKRLVLALGEDSSATIRALDTKEVPTATFPPDVK